LWCLNHGAFFKQYHVREARLPGKQSAKITAKVAETMAWKDGKRIGLGSKDYLASTKLDPACRRTQLHFVFRAGWRASPSRPTATTGGHRLGGR